MFSESDLKFAKKKLTGDTPSSLVTILGIIIGKNPELRNLTEQDLVDALRVRSEVGDMNGSTLTSLDRLQRDLKMRQDEEMLTKVLLSVEGIITEVRNTNRTIIDYMIISDKTQSGLNMEVQKWLPSWQPFGGAGAAAFGISPIGGNQYFQAIVKYRE